MKKLSAIFILIIVSVSFWGCSKSYLDSNTPNPNNATSATPEQVITNAMTTTVAFQVVNLGSTDFLNGWMGYWAPSGSYAQNSNDVASYKETTTFGDGLWQIDYHNLGDYYFVEQASKKQIKPFYEAMAKAMKSLVFQQLVDNFNNIPYKQAFQGTKIIQPKYDSAQTIYEDLSRQLDTAANLMQSPAAIGAAGSDIMFGGNNALWVAFANTLKLRILMRQTQMPGRDAYIKAEIAKIVTNGGGFLTQDASINPPYANNSGQQSPLWGFFRTLTGFQTSGGTGDYYRASTYGINILTANIDPRLPFIYSKDQNGGYTGSVFGSATNPPGNATSSVGPGLLKSVNQGAVLISAAESYFLQAEANVRGYLGATTDAKTNYEAGVQASFNFLGAGDATAYLNQAGNANTTWAAATTQASQIALIIRQKWIAENGVTPFETWADYRRLGLPADIPISVSPVKNSNTVPVRLLYPVSEYTTNAANVGAQGNIDYYTSKVFWNVN